MALTITTAPLLSDADRAGLITTGLDWMYQSFGFIEAR